MEELVVRIAVRPEFRDRRSRRASWLVEPRRLADEGMWSGEYEIMPPSKRNRPPLQTWVAADINRHARWVSKHQERRYVSKLSLLAHHDIITRRQLREIDLCVTSGAGGE